MTTFVLVRHAETDAVGRVLAGCSPGWSLNAAGEAQAKRLAERLSGLPLRGLYTSPLERARETAEPIASALSMRACVRPDFTELRMGAWEGLPFDRLQSDSEWRAYNAHREWSRPPGGELLVEVQHRMIRGLEALHARHDGEAVAVISHLDPLRVLLCHCLGVPLAHLTRFTIDPASMSLLELHAGGSLVRCINSEGVSLWRH